VIIHQPKGRYAEQTQRIKREVLTWASLHHPNILPLIGLADDGDKFIRYGALISPVRNIFISISRLISLSGVPTETQRNTSEKKEARSAQMIE
jgi:hypothetical protein